MDLDEVRDRLTRFVRHQLGDPAARIAELEPGPGHAGFSYLFDVRSAAGLARYFMRLPPPGVKHEGTGDVLRQVCALRALDGTDVPHAPVIWAGDDPEWFGDPYFIVPRIEGDVLRGDFVNRFDEQDRRRMGRQAMRALAGIHRVDWRTKCAYLGEFWGFEFDVTRWDRFYERAADQHLLALQPRVRQLLLDTIPANAHIGLYHGDFQFSNTMFSPSGDLLAVIDWELTGIGATLNDVGWVSVFARTEPWPPGARENIIVHGDELEAMYAEAWGAPLEGLPWFKALALYKFGIITGFNLMLHRRGKRHDPHWEDIGPGMQSNMEYAMGLLGR